MSSLDIRVQSMLGTSHSWAVTMRSLIKEFHGLGHELYLDSINGYEMFPINWTSMKRSVENPDIDLCYTLPRNFKDRFLKKSKLKLAVYNYETSVLPPAWSQEHRYVDFVLPSSNFSKEVFVNAGWPEDKCIVVPHGINPDDFLNKKRVKNLKTKKSFKFLNVSIPHYRKNIFSLVDAYYEEFSKEDDVCLIIKTNTSRPKYKFECDVIKEIRKVQKKHKHKRLNFPQLEIVKHKYDSIIPLYNSCDCLVSATSSEGFGLPLLEALAAGMLVVAPHYTGQADFLNEHNSLKVFSREVDAPPHYQYWRPTKGAKTFMPDVDSLRANMRNAYENKQSLLNDFSKETQSTIKRFTWRSAAEEILRIG
jgi:glycosyltransferase involved in cell wall biosynthesis